MSGSCVQPNKIFAFRFWSNFCEFWIRHFLIPFFNAEWNCGAFSLIPPKVRRVASFLTHRSPFFYPHTKCNNKWLCKPKKIFHSFKSVCRGESVPKLRECNPSKIPKIELFFYIFICLFDTYSRSNNHKLFDPWGKKHRSLFLATPRSWRFRAGRFFRFWNWIFRRLIIGVRINFIICRGYSFRKNLPLTSRYRSIAFSRGLTFFRRSFLGDSKISVRGSIKFYVTLIAPPPPSIPKSKIHSSSPSSLKVWTYSTKSWTFV